MKADAQLIAKVLEGRATLDERAAVLAEADRSPELLALLADSAAALGVDADVIPMKPRRTMRPAMLGLGAALVAAAGLFFLWPRGEAGIPAGPFPAAISMSDLGPARLGAGVIAVRGSADADRVLQSVIIGARLTDYQVLGADSARETAAIEIANALRSIPGGEVAAAPFGAGGSISQSAIAAVEGVVHVPAFRAAQWMELTRLAAAAGDARTLERTDVLAALSAIGSDTTLPVAARDLTSRIREQLDGNRDLRVVADLANQGLRALIRP